MFALVAFQFQKPELVFDKLQQQVEHEHLVVIDQIGRIGDALNGPQFFLEIIVVVRQVVGKLIQNNGKRLCDHWCVPDGEIIPTNNTALLLIVK